MCSLKISAKNTWPNGNYLDHWDMRRKIYFLIEEEKSGKSMKKRRIQETRSSLELSCVPRTIFRIVQYYPVPYEKRGSSL